MVIPQIIEFSVLGVYARRCGFCLDKEGGNVESVNKKRRMLGYLNTFLSCLVNPVGKDVLKE